MAMTSNFGSDGKTVCLEKFWLIKAEEDFNEKRLVVGGLILGGLTVGGLPVGGPALRDFFLRRQQAAPVFSSLPIIKRYDLFTLETADGITIKLRGSIDKSRTEENGFSSEVCSHFLFGFPYDWETYADRCFGKESTTTGGQKHEHEEKGLHIVIRQDDNNVKDDTLLIQSIQDGTDKNDSTRDVSRIPKTQEKVREETNLHSLSRSQDYEAVIGISVEEKLGQGNSFDIVGVVDGIETTLEQSSSTSDLKMSPGQEQSTNKKQKKSGRKKRNTVSLPPVARSTKERSLESLSPRRSRSGRLLVPPNSFGRNQHPVYGVDGRFVPVHQYKRILDRRMELVKKRKAAAEAELEVIKAKVVKAMSEELEIQINIDTNSLVLTKLEKELEKEQLNKKSIFFGLLYI